MSVHFIEGGAGTGKTTTLIARLGQILQESPLAEFQRVLALTKMHGSRRRVCERLQAVAGLNRRFDSMTIDSFAWRLVRRWRSLARELTGTTIPTEFDAICELAGKLAEQPCVQTWVASSFPIVVVDELQDSKGGQLRILKALCIRCVLIAAGDPFQDLDGEGPCASVEWARSHGTPTVLVTIHRTNKKGLLEAAAALRNSRPVAAAGGFSLKAVTAAPLGAWEVASKIANWKRLGTVAVITPVRAARSAFVRQIVDRVNSKPLGKKWVVGPFKVPWETAQDEQIIATCRDLGLPDDDKHLVRADVLNFDGGGRTGSVHEWISRQRRLFGRLEFSAAEVREVVRDIVQQSRFYARRAHLPLIALSIHQAKNREFDRVILLWPYEVSGDDERKRRLAYNAITRARYDVHVVVQGEARATQSPFVPEANPPSGTSKNNVRRPPSGFPKKKV